MATKLTDVKVEAIRPDKVKRLEIPDSGAPGLYLVVQPNRKRSWACRYRWQGAPRKLTLGTYPTLTLAEAREAAHDALKRVARGEDPAATKRAGKVAQAASDKSLAAAFHIFLERHTRTRSGVAIRELTRRGDWEAIGLQA